MPSESSRSGVVLELAEEFLERYRNGERPSLQEYIDRRPELAAEIRAVFPAVAMMENIALDAEALTEASRERPRPEALQQLGDFRILREVGRGGMGIVYEAEQVSLGRHVALKVLPRKLLLDARSRQRFEREARAAAKLHHTNIVPVFGVGEHDGLPYYVMQFIQGLGLDKVLGELKQMQSPAAVPVPERPRESFVAAVARSLVTGRFEGTDSYESDPNPADGEPVPTAVPRSSDRLALSGSTAVLPGHGKGLDSSGTKRRTYWHSVAQLGIQVAEALEHAHRQGVLHRDVKPSNLLLDARGNVWVTDFGLAKDEDQQNLTATGDVLGTLRYLPPEAFDGKADACGDVYSLGLTLYEMLALRPAFAEKDRKKLIRQVTEAEPPRLDRLNPAVPRDLVTIIHKAIERSPTLRYTTAADFAEDLKLYADDRSIRARRVGPVERLGRWCRRNPWVAGLTATVAFLLVAVAVGATVAAIRLDHHAQAAIRSARAAEDRLVRLNVANGERHLDAGDLLGSLPWFAEALTLDRDDPDELVLHRERLATVLRQCPRLTQLWCLDRSVLQVEFSSDGRRLLIADEKEARVWDVTTGRPASPPLTYYSAATLAYAELSPDGRRVVAASYDGRGQVWDADTGVPVGAGIPPGPPVRQVRFSPDSRWLLVARPEEARVWDVLTGEPISPPLRHDGGVRPRKPGGLKMSCAAFSPNGRWVVTGSGGLDDPGEARVWDVKTGKEVCPPLRHKPGVLRHVTFSPDGRWVVTAGADLTAQLWEAATGQRVAPALEHGGIVYRTAFSPDGRRVVTASHDGTAQVWESATGQRVGLALRHGLPVHHAAFSRDGHRVVTAGEDGTARVWDAQTGQPVAPPLPSHHGQMRQAEFSPDGRCIVTAGSDGAVRLWDLSAASDSTLALKHEHPVHHVAFSPDGRRLATASGVSFRQDAGAVRVWDAATGQPVGMPLRHRSQVYHVSFSPDGSFLVTANGCSAEDGVIAEARVWEVATGKAVSPPLVHEGHVWDAAFSPDGRRVVTASTDRTAQVWEVATGQPACPPLRHEYWVNSAAFSPDGRLVVTTCGNWSHGFTGINARVGGTARLWDATTGRTIVAPLQHAGSVVHAAFSPDGRRLVTACSDGTAQVWEVETGRRVGPELKHEGLVNHVAFSPDGQRVVTASHDHTARVWEVPDGRPAIPPLKHRYYVAHAAFSPDGRHVVTASHDGTARVWDAANGQALSPALKHEGPVVHAAFSPEGRRVVTAGEDQTARIWSLAPEERPLDDLVLLTRLLSGRQIDPTGGVVPFPIATAREVWTDVRSRYPETFTPAP